MGIDIGILTGIFVCLILISVKSKYSSCSGSCTGLITIKQLSYVYHKVSILEILTLCYIPRRVPFAGMTG